MQLKYCQRIKLQSDFDLLRSLGSFKNCNDFFVKIRKNSENILPRFAVIVGKKIGKAHQRNHIKRIFRNIFQQEQSRLNRKNDYLIIARKGIKPKFHVLKEKFLNVCAEKKIFITVAIDGMAASGKSSASLLLAKKNRLLNVNTGDHYRSLVHFLSQNEIKNIDDPRILNFLEDIKFGTQMDGISAHMSINGKIPTKQQLRSQEINQMVSFFAKLDPVRKKLKSYQQSLIEFAKQLNFSGIVMEGRDICSVIMPNADVKIFLKADLEIRESRRKNDGEFDVIQKRDAIDYNICENDVTVIDTSENNLEQVISNIDDIISKKCNGL